MRNVNSHTILRLISLFFLLTFLLAGCKTSRVLTGKHKAMSTKDILQHFEMTDSFPSAASFRFAAEISSQGNEQSGNCYIRMYKDSLIWISVRSMSFEGMRAIVTPDSIQFIDRLNNLYYKGDFSLVNRFSPMALDFYDMQKLLLGRMLDYNQQGEKSLETCNDSACYCLYSNTEMELQYDTVMKAFNPQYVNQKYLFYPQNFFLAEQSFFSRVSKDNMSIIYGPAEQFDSNYYPESLTLRIDGYQRSELKLETKSISFDNQFKTPFKIPDKYQEMRF